MSKWRTLGFGMLFGIPGWFAPEGCGRTALGTLCLMFLAISFCIKENKDDEPT